MKCRKCGIEIADDAKYCPECGTSITGDVVAPPPLTEGIERNNMVPVFDNATVLRGPMMSQITQMQYIEARATDGDKFDYRKLPVGKLGLKRFGVVFLSKGESANWKTILAPAGEYAVDEIFGQLLGSALGHIASTSIKADYEKQLEESLAKSPATFIIPASVIVNVKAETIDKHVYIRIRTDEGKVFSIVKGDPFMSEKNWSNLENAIWLMRHAYERFYFFGTLLYLHLPEQKRSEIFVEYVKEFFGTKGVSEKLHEKIDALLKTQGTSWGRLEGERQYHMQRWLKSKWGEQLKHEYKWLDEVKEYYPLCFACKVNAKRSKAKYCQQCGLSMC